MARAPHIGRHVLVALALATTAADGLVIAQDGRAMVRPGDLRWPPATTGGTGTSGVSGIQTVVLKGDPTKTGLYTLMLRIAPNIRIQAHSHRDDRVATVIKARGTSATAIDSMRPSSSLWSRAASTRSRPTLRTSR